MVEQDIQVSSEKTVQMPKLDVENEGKKVEKRNILYLNQSYFLQARARDALFPEDRNR